MGEEVNQQLELFGHWSFLVGVSIAFIAGLFTTELTPGNETILFTLLFTLGIVVGLLNITIEETETFLVAVVALLLSSAVDLGRVPLIGEYVNAILTNIVVFVVPSALIVALTVIWKLASDK